MRRGLAGLEAAHGRGALFGVRRLTPRRHGRVITEAHGFGGINGVHVGGLPPSFS